MSNAGSVLGHMPAATPGRLGTFTLRGYLIVSTVASAFGLVPIVDFGTSSLWVGYPLLLCNILLLLAIGRLVVPKPLLWWLFVIGLVSVVAAVLAHRPLVGVIYQLFGIGVFFSYYYSALAPRLGPIGQVFHLYRRFALAIAGLGIIIWGVKYGLDGYPDRLTSIFSEPSFFVYSTLPCLSYCILKWRERHNVLYLLVLIPSYALADSSLGFIGILATFVVAMRGRSLWGVLLAGVVTIVVAIAAYALSDNVKKRVDDSLKTQITMEAVQARRAAIADPDGPISVEQSNASTRALYSNAYVAYRAFLSNPLIGTGIGTHSASYDEYAPEILSDQDSRLYGLNKYDAASTFLRVASEGGVFGLFLLGYFFWYFCRVKSSPAKTMRDALLPVFIVEIIRQGAYFNFALDFFIVMFIFNYLEDQRLAARVHAAAWQHVRYSGIRP